MNDNIKAGADIHAGDFGYSIGTQEKYEEFVKRRNQSMNRFEEFINLVETDTSGKWVKTEDVRRVAEQVLSISVEYLKECDSDFEGEMLEDFWWNESSGSAGSIES